MAGAARAPDGATPDLAQLVHGLDAALRAAGDPDRAVSERAYLKSDLVHLGVGVPGTRRLVRSLVAEHGPFGHDEVVALVDALWGAPVHERRLAAVELLTVSTSVLDVDDADRCEALLRACRTWALLDPLALGVVGILVDEDPAAWDPVLRRWAQDDDHWLRRTALLAHLPALRRGGGGWDRFTELADAMLEEREFFVRKAIGWVLREVGKRRPELVVAWLEPRLDRASGLTRREAVKHLPATDRQRLSR